MSVSLRSPLHRKALMVMLLASGTASQAYTGELLVNNGLSQPLAR